MTGSLKAPGEEVVSQNLNGDEHQWKGNHWVTKDKFYWDQNSRSFFVATAVAALTG